MTMVRRRGKASSAPKHGMSRGGERRCIGEGEGERQVERGARERGERRESDWAEKEREQDCL